VPSVAAIEAAPGRHVRSSLTDVDLQLLQQLVATRW